MTTKLVYRYLTKRLVEDKIAPKTYNRIRGTLHAFMNWAIEQEYIEVNPVARVKRMREPERSIRYLTLEQIDEQLEALKEQPRVQVMVAVYLRDTVEFSRPALRSEEDVKVARVRRATGV